MPRESFWYHTETLRDDKRDFRGGGLGDLPPRRKIPVNRGSIVVISSQIRPYDDAEMISVEQSEPMAADWSRNHTAEQRQ